MEKDDRHLKLQIIGASDPCTGGQVFHRRDREKGAKIVAKGFYMLRP
jgi:hypothetical protein